MAVEGGSRLFSWFGFVPESTDSPVETAGTTRSPGLCLPPWERAFCWSASPPTEASKTSTSGIFPTALV